MNPVIRDHLADDLLGCPQSSAEAARPYPALAVDNPQQPSDGPWELFWGSGGVETLKGYTSLKVV